MKEFTSLPPGGHAPTTATITSCAYNCGARCENGVDRGGCINILTKYHPTPLTKGNPQHTNLVQVEKLEKAEG